MVREAITSDIPNIRALMQAEPGFWQPSWSDKTIATASSTRTRSQMRASDKTLTSSDPNAP